eukprot:COSAG02_NODE_4186_length_5652_cov_3.112372_3_plen_74_part_00
MQHIQSSSLSFRCPGQLSQARSFPTRSAAAARGSLHKALLRNVPHSNEQCSIIIIYRCLPFNLRTGQRPSLGS